MLKKQFPLYYTLLAMLTSILISGAVFYYYTHETTVTQKGEVKLCSEFMIARLSGYKFIKPLVYAEQSCESRRYSPLKKTVEGIISDLKAKGVLTQASIYLRDFRQGEWTVIGANQTFTPGSLIKVPLLMTYMRMEERAPGLLNRKLVLHQAAVPPQTYTTHHIEFEKEYTVRELLTYMIADSDNYATLLLNQNIDVPALRKLFTDLGLPEPDVTDRNFQITTQEYSVFLKALYNASYLTINNSEFAVELLANCNFREGMVKLLPASLKVAHKFGESGTAFEGQLHESGIVYLADNPYLLVIMTKGPDVKKLPEVLAVISKTVYDEMVKHP